MNRLKLLEADMKFVMFLSRGRDISVGIATGYGLDGLGIESRWRRDFLHMSRLALGLTQPPVQWVPGLSRGYKRPGSGADHPPPSSAEVKKSSSTPLSAFGSVTGYLYVVMMGWLYNEELA
jgi:hypothetical protein